jgi:TonB family protein
MSLRSSTPILLSLAVSGFLAASGSTVLASTEADSAPQIDLSAANAQPYFPQTAMKAGEHGTAVVAVDVNAIGTPFKVQLSQSSGFADLDSQAVEAIRSWHFVPAKRGGESVSEWTAIGIRFDNAGVTQVPVSADSAVAEADRNRVICRVDKTRTGSNIPPSPVCMAKWQWDQREVYDQKTMQDAIGHSGMASGTASGGSAR